MSKFFTAPRSIQSKLNRIVMDTLSAAMFVIFVFQVVNESQLTLEKTETELTILADITAYNVASAVLFNDVKAASELLESLKRHPDILKAEVVVAKQQVFSEYQRSTPASIWASRYPSYSLITVTRPIELQNEKLGQVSVTLDLGNMYIGLMLQGLSILGISLIIYTLCYAIVHRFTRVLLLPIQRLAEASRHISETEQYSLRVTQSSNDELGNLIVAFNHMLEQIELSNNLLKSVIDHIPVRVFWKDLNSRYLGCNWLFAQDAGLSEPQQLIGKVDLELVWKEQAALYRADDQAVVESGQPKLSYEEPQTTPQGKQIWLQTSKTPLRDSKGAIIGVLGIYEDITERKQAAIKLQLAANVFTHAREGILITDIKGIIIDVNDTFSEITGYARDEVIGQTPRLFKSERQSSEFYAEMWQSLIANDHWYGEIWNRHKDGKLYAAMLTISAVKNDDGDVRNYVALFSDITAMKNHQHQLEHMAHFDALTNLPNRVLLADRLQQAIGQCKRHKRTLAVVYIDLDGFKTVNDNYGHEMGDELLIAVSRRMKESLRECDTLSRIGGDEFVAVLVDLDHRDDYDTILNRLLDTASQPVKIHQNIMQVSASIGVTFFPEDCVDAEQLVRHADQAMYAAKQSGKNNYRSFDVNRDVAIKTYLANIDRIAHALKQQEFVLYYQPKVNMKTGCVFGAEALIRWQHPDQGLLPPGHFLPVIEDNPLGIELGEWVISCALSQLAQWQRHDLHMTVSVNISAKHLQQDDFAFRLKMLLAQFPEVDPRHLELEILETSALQDLAKVSSLMHQCNELGVRFALDDFGTGYSSLTYLKHLPAEVIKIDQSFVRDMLEDADDLAIVQGVIGLAASFHREVVAEGVETTDHCQKLLLMGCELAQGYGIARPMPGQDFPQWVAKGFAQE